MFWLAVGGFLLAGYALYAASEGIGFRGMPTPTKAGAEDDKGPQLRQYVDNLYANLKRQGLAFDEWGVDWRTVLLLYKDPNTEAIVMASALLPERAVDLDKKFYRFKTHGMKGELKKPQWATDEEE